MPTMLTRSVSYDIVTEESAAYGDAAEHGWRNEDETVRFRDAVEECRNRGIESITAHRSYVTIYHHPEQNFRTGNWHTEATHLEGTTRAVARLARILSATN